MKLPLCEGVTGDERIDRAWILGIYDRAAVKLVDSRETVDDDPYRRELARRLATSLGLRADAWQCPAPALPVKTLFWVIARCPTRDCPCYTSSVSTYHSLVRTSSDWMWTSVARGFGSSAEVFAYCLGLDLPGFPEPLL